MLLEKNELTSGSTWHAAGNVPTFSSSWSLMNMQRYSTELYRGLAEGGRLSDELPRHRLAAARPHDRAHAGVPARQGHGPLPGHGHRRRRPRRDQAPLSLHRDARPEGRALRPERRRHRSGAADPGAGQGRARHGREDHPLLPGDRRAARERRMGASTTPKGEIRCEYVVNAAGYRAAEVGKTVRPRRADDGDEPSVHPVRGDPGTRGLVEGGRPQAAAAARRRHVLLSAAGKGRHEPRPL